MWAFGSTEEIQISDTRGTRLLGIGAAMLAIHVARALLTYANRYSIAWVGQRVIIQIGREMFGRLERLPLRYFERQESGVTMSRLINDVNSLQMALMGPTVNAVVGMVDMCIYLAILLTL